jgi:molybdopterin/thiamine biosynthesis adenylyltransferase
MDLYRITGLLELEIVSSKKLLFLGAGSLGSLTVANLAYPWKEIVLVDAENLEQENVERHLLGKRYLGRAKVEGIAEYLVDKGVDPGAITVHAIPAQNVLDQHIDADLAIVSIDERGALYDINTWCVENNIPAVYGGIYPGGTGGEVIVIASPGDVCYHCAVHKMGRDIYKGLVINYGLGEATEASSTQGLAVLHWAINSTAADMADFALEILSGGNPQHQVVVRAHNTWESILNLGSGSQLNALSAYIVSQTEMGLVPNMKLAKAERRYTLKANRSIFSLALDRWEECPIHKTGQTYSYDDL